MKSKVFFACLFLLAGNSMYGVTVLSQLHIRSGYFKTLDNDSFYYVTCNEQATFSQNSAVIKATHGDSIRFVIHNHDTASHTFQVPGKGQVQVNASDSGTLTLYFGENGVFLFREADPVYTYLGFSGIIGISNDPNSNRNFYWNLKEQQKNWNKSAGAGMDLSKYDPDYFTINGQSYPTLQNDSDVKITGHVGDTLLLFLVNTGNSSHSIHFHGYHGRVVSTTSHLMKKDWEKDTFPIEPMESVLIMIIPDKAGEFPVHDHNLVAISGGGRYPNGMLVMMEVQP